MIFMIDLDYIWIIMCMKIAGAQIAIDFSYNEGFAPMAIEKMKILGAVLELPAKQHCQFGPFTKHSGRMGWIGSAI